MYLCAHGEIEKAAGIIEGCIMKNKVIAENLPPQPRESGLFCCRGLIGPEGEGKKAKIPYDPKTS